MDNKEHSDGSYRLGIMHADIKHILAGQERTREDFVGVDKKFVHIEERLDKVERFNVKVLAIVGVVAPLLMVALNMAVTHYMK